MPLNLINFNSVLLSFKHGKIELFGLIQSNFFIMTNHYLCNLDILQSPEGVRIREFLLYFQLIVF